MTGDMKVTYHHGDLRAALLRAARMLLEQEGIAALKLRAITRHAGVSATAAAPHFGNLTGLLSALAAIGYDELTDAMAPAVAPDPREVGLAYVRFAIANPGLFTLMFRSDAIDRSDSNLKAASAKAFARLSELSGPTGGRDQGSNHAATMAALWGKVHGLAILAIDGLLLELAKAAQPPMTLDALIEGAIR